MPKDRGVLPSDAAIFWLSYTRAICQTGAMTDRASFAPLPVRIVADRHEEGRIDGDVA